MTGGDGSGGGAERILRIHATRGIPVVSLRLWIAGGARRESIPGQALVTGRLLAEGTTDHDWRQIGEAVESRGMVLGAFGHFEGHGVAIDALARDWERALDWAFELVGRAAFPSDRCEWIRRQATAELESLGDQPEVRAAWRFLEQLYGDHARGRPLQGSAAGLASLTPADCARFHAEALNRQVVLGLAGAIDEARVAERARSHLDGLAPSTGDRPPPPEPPAGRLGDRLEVPLPGSEQAHLYLGHLTVPRSHPDLVALELVGIVLGAGPGLAGRIPDRVREKAGLAYSVQVATTAGAGTDPGRFVVYLGTAAASVEAAEGAVREEVARLLDDGISEEELVAARSFLELREPFRRETPAQWADLLAEAELFGVPVDREEWLPEELARLDRRAVEAAARRHLSVDRLQVTVGLPGES